METISIKIQAVNRVGITHEIIACLSSEQIDIIQMEVKPYYIFLKIPMIDESVYMGLLSAIKQIAGVQKIEPIHYLPSEMRENQMNTILSTISDGILSVDGRFCIQTVNRAAEQMLQIESPKLVGKSILSVWKSMKPQLDRCLKTGVEILNISMTLSIGVKRTAQFIVSFLPLHLIESQEQHGAIIVLKDLKQIQELIQSVKRTGVVHFDDIIHNSEEMRECMETAKRIAKSNATVFLSGESGTGKELFARAIHYESTRASGPFVPINCSAIPEALMESELFGYEGGAFTGAIKGGKQGLIEAAQGGTLFLDEIGELPLHLQAKLLRVLEDRTIRRVGGHQLIPIDVRIIAATNRDLVQMREQKQFREDLFYRLHVIPIRIPPLRERMSDIPLLAEHFMRKCCTLTHREPLSFSYQAIHLLQSYHWPGNVRELQNVIERTIYLYPEESSEITKVYIEKGFTNKKGEFDLSLSLKEQMEIHEKKILSDVLKKYKTARKAAQQLGLSHTAVLKKMKKYNLDGE